MSEAMSRRLRWVQMYVATGDAGLTCRRCGISRPTLRLWAPRFRVDGESELIGASRRTKRSPRRCIFQRERDQILCLRCERNLGARRIQIALRLIHEVALSITSIPKALDAAAAPPPRKPRRAHATKRYARAVPGDRVQMDAMKIAAALHQYTAVDDCSRLRVLGLLPHRSGTSTLRLLECALEEMLFAIRRIQKDRGAGFFAERVQHRLAGNFIKFQPIPPHSLHLNGKVEHSQRTDLQDFCVHQNYCEPELSARIEEWKFDYDGRRPHDHWLAGRPPRVPVSSSSRSRCVKTSRWPTI